MGYISGLDRKPLNNRSRLWLIITLLSCLLIAACDASNTSGNTTIGNCNGTNNCNNTTNSSSGVTNSASSNRPIPSPTPSPTPETRAYKADWSNGLDGWIQSGGWSSVNSMLVNDGMDYNNDGHPTATAPALSQNITNYSVQVDIRLDRYADAGGISGLASFGVVVHWSQDQNGGYKIGACASGGIYSCGNTSDALFLSDGSFFQDPPVKQAPFQAAQGVWHTYRIDVQGNTITVWLDGGMIFQATDDKFLSAGSVGLWSDRSQISVGNFMMTAL